MTGVTSPSLSKPTIWRQRFWTIRIHVRILGQYGDDDFSIEFGHDNAETRQAPFPFLIIRETPHDAVNIVDSSPRLRTDFKITSAVSLSKSGFLSSNSLRAPWRPIQKNAGQESCEYDGDPEDGFACARVQLNRWKECGYRTPGGENHGEGIAADHPSAVLGNVAAANAVERDRRAYDPSQRLHAVGCDH